MCDCFRRWKQSQKGIAKIKKRCIIFIDSDPGQRYGKEAGCEDRDCVYGDNDRTCGDGGV